MPTGRPAWLAVADQVLQRWGRDAVAAAFDRYEHGRHLDDHDTARLLLLHPDVLDHAWERIRPQREHLRMWIDLTRRATGRLVPAPACLLAFTAWRQGHGTLANAAVDRALAADPTYSLAHELSQLLQLGVPPSAWDDIHGRGH